MVENNETRAAVEEILEELTTVEFFTKKLRKRKARYEEHKGSEDEAQYARWWCWHWKAMKMLMKQDGYNDESLREFEPPAELLETNLFADFGELD